MGRAAARRPPPGGRHRRAPDDGARHGGARWTRRCRCASPAWATTSARARRRPTMAAPHRPRGAQREAGARAVRAAARADRLPRAGRGGGARTRQHPPQRRARAPPRWCACSSAATRCAGRSASTRCCSPASAMRAGGSARTTQPYPQRPRLAAALRVALAVDATAPIAEPAAARGLAARRSARRCTSARVRAVPTALAGQRADPHRDQAEQHAAGHRHEPLAAAPGGS